MQETCPGERPDPEDAGSSAVGEAMALHRAAAARLASYAGSSMYPTLDATDLLEIAPCAGRAVRPGDVILFASPEGGCAVVHRVVRVTPQGIRTRGDNAAHDDDWLLQPSEVRGRVVAAWRGRRRRMIAGGRPGWVLGRLLNARLWMDRNLSRPARSLYRALACRGILARRLPASWRPRPVVFRTPGHSQLRLLLGQRVAGHYDSRRQRWVIRPLYRLLVDEAALPSGPTRGPDEAAAGRRGGGGKG